MNRACIIPILASTLACATHRADVGPFAAEPAAAVNQMRVLAVAPVSVAADITVPDSLLMALESALIGELREAGISVVPPATYQRLWDEVYAGTDPIYDEYTGERNEAAYQEAWRTFYAAVKTQHGAAAVLFPEIWEVQAEVVDGYASWDGTSQNMASTGSHILAILDALVPDEGYDGDNNILPSGVVEALSLSVVVEDSSGTALYSRRAGIQSLRERITSERLEGSQLFENSERFDHAVEQALNPLLNEYRRQRHAFRNQEPIATENR